MKQASLALGLRARRREIKRVTREDKDLGLQQELKNDREVEVLEREERLCQVADFMIRNLRMVAAIIKDQIGLDGASAAQGVRLTGHGGAAQTELMRRALSLVH